MQLWMSAEVWREVAEAEQLARPVIEAAFNERYGAADYGSGVAEWAFIAMIAPPGVGYPEERRRYDAKRRVLEFRLRIDYDRFAAADRLGCRRLLAEALDRSLSLASGMRVPDFDLARLQADFLALASERGWLALGESASHVT